MSHYDALLQNGWRMNDIDDMDFIGYLDVLLWRATKDIKPTFIDDCPMLQTTEV